jgi:hypothetical protein
MAEKYSILTDCQHLVWRKIVTEYILFREVVDAWFGKYLLQEFYVYRGDKHLALMK